MTIAHYRVADENDNEWLFDAPLYQVACILNLHGDAMRRVEREGVMGNLCKLHGNGKLFLGRYPCVTVTAVYNVDEILS